MKLSHQMPVFRLFLFVLCLTGLMDFSSAQAQQLPNPQVLARHGLKLGWWGYASINPKRDKITSVSITEDMVFMQTNSGHITAFDAETGKRMWAVKPTSFDTVPYPVTTNRELAIIVAGLKVYAHDRLTGQQLWELSIPQYPSTSVAVDTDRLYFGTLDGTLFAYDLRKIKTLFEAGKLPQYTESAEVWRYRASQEITTTPIVDGNVVLFASRNGSVYCVEAATRKLMFRFETDAPIMAPLTTNGKSVFVASRDYNNYAINPRNGTVLWHYVSGFPIDNSPIPIGDQILLTPRGGGLASINAETGLTNWDDSVAPVEHFLAASKKRIFTSDFLRNMIIIDRSNGNIEAKLPMQLFNVWPSNPRTDRIFLANEAGLIVMLHEEDQEFPIYYTSPELRPLVPEFASESGNPATDTPTPNNPFQPTKPADDKPKDEPKKPVVIPFPSAF